MVVSPSRLKIRGIRPSPGGERHRGGAGYARSRVVGATAAEHRYTAEFAKLTIN